MPSICPAQGYCKRFFGLLLTYIINTNLITKLSIYLKESILNEVKERAKEARFDERVTLIWLLIGLVTDRMKENLADDALYN